MSNPYFSFQRFTVHHDRCAMKVGTDGVLLGAWADVSGARRILDIGTGTGLIALMLAQRCERQSAPPEIVALDIDASAVGQARENVAASPWPQCVRVEQQDAATFQDGRSYDLVVSNPPYYNSLKSPDAQRDAARHTDSLSFAALTASASRLLATDGRLCVVIPADAEREFLAAAAHDDLFPWRRLQVSTKPGAPVKRILLELRRTARQDIPLETLLLEDAPGQRSGDYKALTADFYLR
jgi:tRNA1Val (adenine37-N6)-methyltransferase